MKLTKLEEVLLFNKEHYLGGVSKWRQKYNGHPYIRLSFWVLTENNFLKIFSLHIEVKNRDNDDIFNEIIERCFNYNCRLVSFDDNAPQLLKSNGIDFNYETNIRDGETYINLFGI